MHFRLLWPCGASEPHGDLKKGTKKDSSCLLYNASYFELLNLFRVDWMASASDSNEVFCGVGGPTVVFDDCLIFDFETPGIPVSIATRLQFGPDERNSGVTGVISLHSAVVVAHLPSHVVDIHCCVTCTL